MLLLWVMEKKCESFVTLIDKPIGLSIAIVCQSTLDIYIYSFLFSIRIKNTISSIRQISIILGHSYFREKTPVDMCIFLRL